MIRKVKRLFLAILALVVISSTASAQGTSASPGTPEVITDNPELNEMIASGKVMVEVRKKPNAAETARIDAKLKKLGYPDDFAKSASVGVKDLLVRRGIRYNESFMPKSSRDDLGVMALDPDWIDWSYRVDEESTSTKNRFYLTSFWQWLRMPTFNLTDKIGWAWAGTDRFFYEDGSLANNAVFIGYPDTGDTGDWYSLEVSNDKTVNSSPGNGIGTEVRLVSQFTYDGTTYHVTEMFGAAQVVVTRTRTNTGDTRDFSSASGYFHKQGSLTGSLTYGGSGLSLGISYAWQYDESSQPTHTVEYVD